MDAKCLFADPGIQLSGHPDVTEIIEVLVAGAIPGVAFWRPGRNTWTAPVGRWSWKEPANQSGVAQEHPAGQAVRASFNRRDFGRIGARVAIS